MSVALAMVWPDVHSYSMCRSTLGVFGPYSTDGEPDTTAVDAIWTQDLHGIPFVYIRKGDVEVMFPLKNTATLRLVKQEL